jgi:MATE family multidrug resistance protein
MGAEGAGLATLISRVMQTIAIIVYYFSSHRLRIYRAFFERDAVTRSYIRSLFKVGYPISFQMVLESAAFILTSILALSFGEIAAGAMQVTFSIANTAWMITVALGSASTIVVSHLYGLGHLAGEKSLQLLLLLRNCSTFIISHINKVNIPLCITILYAFK